MTKYIQAVKFVDGNRWTITPKTPWGYFHRGDIRRFSQEDGSRCTPSFPGPPWQSSSCCRHCSLGHLKDRHCIFVLLVYCCYLCLFLQANWIKVIRTAVKMTCEWFEKNWQERLTAGELRGINVSAFSRTPPRRHENSFNNIARITLTLLKLSHQEVVFEESVRAERVCKKHLQCMKEKQCSHASFVLKELRRANLQTIWSYMDRRWEWTQLHF